MRLSGAFVPFFQGRYRMKKRLTRCCCRRFIASLAFSLFSSSFSPSLLSLPRLRPQTSLSSSDLAHPLPIHSPATTTSTPSPKSSRTRRKLSASPTGSSYLPFLFPSSPSLAIVQTSHLLRCRWLTPELFLRRPPAKHEDYRLDRLLLRKAQQGVKIYVMVYKEVTQTDDEFCTLEALP
jgi:hypothetical protein